MYCNCFRHMLGILGFSRAGSSQSSTPDVRKEPDPIPSPVSIPEARHNNSDVEEEDAGRLVTPSAPHRPSDSPLQPQITTHKDKRYSPGKLSGLGGEASGHASRDSRKDLSPSPTSPRSDVVEYRINGGKVDDIRKSLLRKALFKARIEWPPRQLRYFVPADVLKKLVQTASIADELRGYQLESLNDETISNLAPVISVRAPKLFAILVCLRLGRFIADFLEEQIDDEHLPFERCNDMERQGGGKLCSRRTPNHPIKCMLDWDQSDIIDFDRDQWYVLAPIFCGNEEMEVPHYELSDNCVLPFVEDEEQKCPLIGGFSTVWRVVIHHAHQELYRCTDRQFQSPSIAVKRLNSTNKEDFDSEVKMLKDFSKHKHPHLVRLLATYHYKNGYYLLFPYAKSNLRKYWEATTLPKFDEATLSWSLHQCKAIASGLHLIHEHHKTQDSEVGFPEDDRTYGRHGDIKPENILWSIEVDKSHEQCCFPEQGFLLIADFGLMDVHKRLTRSRILADTIGGSQTYEPPEIRLKKEVSRAYDIWSLGCLYLEFITWIMLGQDGLRRFLWARSKIDDPVISEDTFYTVVNYAPGISGSKAVVRESVREWIKDLQEHQRCSDFIHEFLDIVEKEMLVVSLSERISCGLLNDRLREMVSKSRTTPSYLTRCNPKSRRMKTSGGPAVHWRHGSNNKPSPRDGFQLPRRGVTN